jgi:hypothetical protein
VQNVSTVEELIAIRNCTDLIVRYTHYIDLGRSDRV